MSTKGIKNGPYNKFFKRCFDIVFSFLLLIILSPMLLIISIIHLFLIKGGIIFAQYRPGKNGKLFKLYKFRSMTNKTDELGNLLPDTQRLTKFGKFLRKTGIDELPQLFNILKGDMSFVGPRPRLVKDVIFYNKKVLDSYTARPGITSLSQINGGRSEASWEDIFEKDREYCENISLVNDIRILFKTVFAIFKKANKSGSAGNSKREYYYADYLLKTNQISSEQYALGLTLASELISKHEPVYYYESLQPQDKNKINN